ncbi:hypothetical protein T492DRAFT_1140587 [Pavlovales sp. CCMP2436]|nr:hypothetical protein T492DRAFT_1140587 [Pavlovales sp. CCMP2436]
MSAAASLRGATPARAAIALVGVIVCVWAGRGAVSGRASSLLAARGPGPTCPVPTLEGRGDICERAFAFVDRPCNLGRHSTLCLDFPMRPLTKRDYDAAVAAAKSPKVRVQIIKNEIFIVPLRSPLASKYPRILLRHLRHIAGAARLVKLPDVDFIINVADGSPPWPYLAHNNAPWNTGMNATYAVPPDTTVLSDTPQPANAPCRNGTTYFERAAWAARDERLQFRGSATGTRVDVNGWASNARARLCAMSKLFPSWIDGKLTQLWTNEVESEVLGSFIEVGKGMPMEQARKYKFVIYLDGHSQSNRLSSLLHTGAIVLVATRYEVPLTASLHRIPHAIPIANDLSDLMLTLGCLCAHPEVAIQRLRLGLEAARRMVTYRNSVLLYWADLLEHYHALQQFPTIRDPRAVPAAKYRFILDGHVVGPERVEIRELAFPYNMSL